jgi:hypothetical protein
MATSHSAHSVTPRYDEIIANLARVGDIRALSLPALHLVMTLRLCDLLERAERDPLTDSERGSSAGGAQSCRQDREVLAIALSASAALLAWHDARRGDTRRSGPRRARLRPRGLQPGATRLRSRRAARCALRCGCARCRHAAATAQPELARSALAAIERR